MDSCSHLKLGMKSARRDTHTDVLLIRFLYDEGDQNPFSVFHQVVDDVMQ